ILELLWGNQNLEEKDIPKKINKRKQKIFLKIYLPLLKKSGTAKFVIWVFVLTLSNYFCRYPTNNCKLWYIFCNYRTSSHNGALTNLNPGKNNCPRTYKYIIPNFNAFMNNFFYDCKIVLVNVMF